MPLGHGHIEDLLEVPPQMIDGRKGEAVCSLAVEQILQLVAQNSFQLLRAEISDEMNPDRFVLFLRVDAFSGLSKASRLPSRTDRSVIICFPVASSPYRQRSFYDRPRIRLDHFLNRSRSRGLVAVTVPLHRNPSVTLLFTDPF